MAFSIISKINTQLWAEFVSNHRKSTIFQTPEFYEVYKDVKNTEPIVLGVLRDGNSLVGLMVAIIQKEAGLIGKFSARSVIYGGPLVEDDDTYILELILQAYIDIVGSKVIYTQIRNQYIIGEAQKEVFLKFDFVYEQHLNLSHDLSKSIDEQKRMLHKGRRKNINRAINSGLIFYETNSTEDLITSINIIEATYRRAGLPCPDKSLFLESLTQLHPTGMLKLFTAKYLSEIVATRLELCYNNQMYDWYAGAVENQLDKYPNDFLTWKILEWGTTNNYETFDFGGAGKPEVPYGVREYKLKFGGELIEMGRFERIHKKGLYNIGKIGLRVYKFIKRWPIQIQKQKNQQD